MDKRYHPRDVQFESVSAAENDGEGGSLLGLEIVAACVVVVSLVAALVGCLQSRMRVRVNLSFTDRLRLICPCFYSGCPPSGRHSRRPSLKNSRLGRKPSKRDQAPREEYEDACSVLPSASSPISISAPIPISTSAPIPISRSDSCGYELPNDVCGVGIAAPAATGAAGANPSSGGYSLAGAAGAASRTGAAGGSPGSGYCLANAATAVVSYSARTGTQKPKVDSLGYSDVKRLPEPPELGPYMEVEISTVKEESGEERVVMTQVERSFSTGGGRGGSGGSGPSSEEYSVLNGVPPRSQSDATAPRKAYMHVMPQKTYDHLGKHKAASLPGSTSSPAKDVTKDAAAKTKAKTITKAGTAKTFGSGAGSVKRPNVLPPPPPSASDQAAHAYDVSTIKVTSPRVEVIGEVYDKLKKCEDGSMQLESSSKTQ